EGSGARQRARVERATRDECRRELECSLLGALVVAANERVAPGLAGRKRPGSERMEPSDNRPAKELLRLLGERHGIVTWKRRPVLEADLAFDAQKPRLTHHVIQVCRSCG